jgi:hypothetical protein
MDETYVRIAGRWVSLFRAVDSHGDTVDFYLSETRDREAAKTFLQKALSNPDHRTPVWLKISNTLKKRIGSLLVFPYIAFFEISRGSTIRAQRSFVVPSILCRYVASVGRDRVWP